MQIILDTLFLSLSKVIKQREIFEENHHELKTKACSTMIVIKKPTSFATWESLSWRASEVYPNIWDCMGCTHNCQSDWNWELKYGLLLEMDKNKSFNLSSSCTHNQIILAWVALSWNEQLDSSMPYDSTICLCDSLSSDPWLQGLPFIICQEAKNTIEKILLCFTKLQMKMVSFHLFSYSNKNKMKRKHFLRRCSQLRYSHCLHDVILLLQWLFCWWFFTYEWRVDWVNCQFLEAHWLRNKCTAWTVV